jgi:hypothetical protein
MANLKKQQKRLLTQEITAKLMEYLMGLSDGNKAAVKSMITKSVKKIVKLYSKSIELQHKQFLKTLENKNEKEVLSFTETAAAAEQTTLMAS